MMFQMWIYLVCFGIFLFDIVWQDHLLNLLPQVPLVLAGVRVATEPQLQGLL